MKLAIICAGLLCSFFQPSKQAETTKEGMLTAHSWELKTHTMAGVGIHQSIPKGTIIGFKLDQSWQSSEPIENFKTGKWSFEYEARTLSMHVGDTNRKFLLLELSSDKLRYRLSKFGAVYKYEWVAKQ